MTTKGFVLLWGLTPTLIITASTSRITSINPLFFTGRHIQIIKHILLLYTVNLGISAIECWIRAKKWTTPPEN